MTAKHSHGVIYQQHVASHSLTIGITNSIVCMYMYTQHRREYEIHTPFTKWKKVWKQRESTECMATKIPSRIAFPIL